MWAYLRAGVGALAGLAPHVMHHIGFLAGAALFAGAVGNTVLYLAGLALSIPLLKRLHRRFRSWRAPAIGVVVFSGMFSLSAFVIGPAFTASTPDLPAAAPSTTVTVPDEHAGHHAGDAAESSGNG